MAQNINRLSEVPGKPYEANFLVPNTAAKFRRDHSQGQQIQTGTKLILNQYLAAFQENTSQGDRHFRTLIDCKQQTNVMSVTCMKQSHQKILSYFGWVERLVS